MSKQFKNEQKGGLRQLFDIFNTTKSNNPSEDARQFLAVVEEVRLEDVRVREKTKNGLIIYAILLFFSAAAIILAGIGGLLGFKIEWVQIIGFVIFLLAANYVVKSIRYDSYQKVEEKSQSIWTRFLSNFKLQNNNYGKRIANAQVAGLAAYIATKLDVPVETIRAIMVILILLSCGFFLPIYFIGAALIPRN